MPQFPKAGCKGRSQGNIFRLSECFGSLDLLITVLYARRGIVVGRLSRIMRCLVDVLRRDLELLVIGFWGIYLLVGIGCMEVELRLGCLILWIRS